MLGFFFGYDVTFIMIKETIIHHINMNENKKSIMTINHLVNTIK